MLDFSCCFFYLGDVPASARDYYGKDSVSDLSALVLGSRTYTDPPNKRSVLRGETSAGLRGVEV